MAATYAELAQKRDELQSECDTLRTIMEGMLEAGNKLKAENEKLRQENEHIRQTNVAHSALIVLLNTAKAEAVKSFAEELIADIEKALDSNYKAIGNLNADGVGMTETEMSLYNICTGKINACHGILHQIHEFAAERGVEVSDE